MLSHTEKNIRGSFIGTGQWLNSAKLLDNEKRKGVEKYSEPYHYKNRQKATISRAEHLSCASKEERLKEVVNEPRHQERPQIP
jgi:hypothetical protein